MSTDTTARATPKPLTARETEILNRLALGETRRQIAEQLGIGHETVRTHLRSAAAKLGPAVNRPFGLSARHVQILAHVAEGLSNAEIGAELNITEMTVKSHLRTMGRPMGCGDRAGMVGAAYRARVLRVPPPCMPRSMAEEMVALARMLLADQPLGRCREVAVRVVDWADAEAVLQGRTS